MKITVFGSGYVGLVTGACLAHSGNEVVCVDIDDEKVAMLNRGEIPIHEAGLQDLVTGNLEAGRLRFTTDAREAVNFGLFQFIAVGTPPGEDGSADLSHVLTVARTIATHMREYKVVICKSTVPVGTTELVQAEVAAVLQETGRDIEFDVGSNPEFLKEGDAVADFMKPDRIIVGTDNSRTVELLRTLYEPFIRNHDRLIAMDIRSAELTKYAANAMLATKISFMNELAGIAERFGADIEHIRLGIGADPRIGYHFIYPGCGYGGSCLPKDVASLLHTAEQAGSPADLLTAVQTVNRRQKKLMFDKVSAYFGGDLNGKRLAVWGLAFKPNTDDMREAPSRALLEALWAAGATTSAYDPVASNEARRLYNGNESLTLVDKAYDALDDADALVIVTEWAEFRSPNFDDMRARMKAPVIFDGRNLYDPVHVADSGFKYYAIGRGEALA